MDQELEFRDASPVTKFFMPAGAAATIPSALTVERWVFIIVLIICAFGFIFICIDIKQILSVRRKGGRTANCIGLCVLALIVNGLSVGLAAAKLLPKSAPSLVTMAPLPDHLLLISSIEGNPDAVREFRESFQSFVPDSIRGTVEVRNTSDPTMDLRQVALKNRKGAKSLVAAISIVRLDFKTIKIRWSFLPITSDGEEPMTGFLNLDWPSSRGPTMSAETGANFLAQVLILDRLFKLQSKFDSRLARSLYDKLVENGKHGPNLFDQDPLFALLSIPSEAIDLHQLVQAQSAKIFIGSALLSPEARTKTAALILDRSIRSKAAIDSPGNRPEVFCEIDTLALFGQKLSGDDDLAINRWKYLYSGNSVIEFGIVEGIPCFLTVRSTLGSAFNRKIQLRGQLGQIYSQSGFRHSIQRVVDSLPPTERQFDSIVKDDLSVECTEDYFFLSLAFWNRVPEFKAYSKALDGVIQKKEIAIKGDTLTLPIVIADVDVDRNILGAGLAVCQFSYCKFEDGSRAHLQFDGFKIWQPIDFQENKFSSLRPPGKVIP